MDNLSIFNQVKNVPPEAQRVITGGRLAGFTEINPMWRIEKLTEILDRLDSAGTMKSLKRELRRCRRRKTVFVDINLYVKQGNEWSKPIQGTGGSMFVAKEKGGMYTSDECFKMA